MSLAKKVTVAWSYCIRIAAIGLASFLMLTVSNAEGAFEAADIKNLQEWSSKELKGNIRTDGIVDGQTLMPIRAMYEQKDGIPDDIRLIVSRFKDSDLAFKVERKTELFRFALLQNDEAFNEIGKLTGALRFNNQIEINVQSIIRVFLAGAFGTLVRHSSNEYYVLFYNPLMDVGMAVSFNTVNDRPVSAMLLTGERLRGQKAISARPMWMTDVADPLRAMRQMYLGSINNAVSAAKNNSGIWREDPANFDEKDTFFVFQRYKMTSREISKPSIDCAIYVRSKLKNRSYLEYLAKTIGGAAVTQETIFRKMQLLVVGGVQDPDGGYLTVVTDELTARDLYGIYVPKPSPGAECEVSKLYTIKF